jgi:hypothetical protein
MDIRITKIKVSSAKKEYPVQISYERDVPEGDAEQVVLPGQGAPHPDLVAAMDGFLEMAIADLRLDHDEWTRASFDDKAHVIGLTIKQDGGPAGVNISIMGKFENEDGSHSCPCPTSGYIPYERFDNRDIAAIERVIREAEAYIGGKRSQGSLFEMVEEAIAA